MGRYKRNKKKVKKEQPFVSAKDVIKYIFDNRQKLWVDDYPTDKFKISKHDIEEGDEWYNESGYQFRLRFADKSEYYVGLVTITEDPQDCAQAESYQTEIMRRSKKSPSDHKKVTGYEILKKLKNIKSLYREERLKKLL